MSKEAALRALRADQLAKLGWQHVENGAFGEAIGALELALSLQPDNTQYWMSLGMAQARALQPEKALAAFHEVLKRDPKHLDAWVCVGELSLDRLDYKLAAQALGECLKLDPNAQHPSGVRARALISRAKKHIAKQRGV